MAHLLLDPETTEATVEAQPVQDCLVAVIRAMDELDGTSDDAVRSRITQDVRNQLRSQLGALRAAGDPENRRRLQAIVDRLGRGEAVDTISPEELDEFIASETAT